MGCAQTSKSMSQIVKQRKVKWKVSNCQVVLRYVLVRVKSSQTMLWQFTKFL